MTIEELERQVKHLQRQIDEMKKESITLSKDGTEFDMYAFPFAWVCQMKKLSGKTERWGWFFKDDRGKIIFEISHRGVMYKGKKIS